MPRVAYYVVGELFFGTLFILWFVFGLSPLDISAQLLYGLTAVKG